MCVQVIGRTQKVYGAVGSCGSGQYKGERCLIPGDDKKPGKFPVTTNGKADPAKIRNVAVRASQFGYTEQVKKGGFCNIAKRAGVKSSLCGNNNND